MFTGIVEEMGIVRSYDRVDTEWGPGMRISINARKVLEGSFLGASISVNGCCLTQVDRGNDEGGDWWATET